MLQDGQGLRWPEPAQRVVRVEEDDVDKSDCMKAQKECRDDVDASIRTRVSWRYAAILIVVVSAILGTCFMVSCYAVLGAGEVKQSVAVQAAAQAKENEFLRRDIEELKAQSREILAIVRALEREKK